ncbi:MAG: bifunctional tRNA (5-methylaminomethyl-2-thiouridine)(34)-methyltransferase MnmD/FAD-dependent 5-carboxymethylaminomethyl-2-thiouridine(34) oxidoreductase MnmC [Burkholderiales bacterium]
MNSAPIEPAALTFTDDGVPFSARYGDIYHPRAGAFTQARHVFVGGNELPARWLGRKRFVVLETGFGLGNNFLATWMAWRDDPQRCEQLVFISVEAHPLTRAELARAHAASPAPELADELQRAWPPLTPNLHTLNFDGGAVQLLLAFGDVQSWLPELVADVDAFYLDGFAPASNPRMWDERVCKALSRLAAPGATLATWSAARALREHLTTAGFQVQLSQGTGGKRDITLARFAPAFTPRRALARIAPQGRSPSHALIVGAGLAGCAAAWALAQQGWRSTLVERRGAIAEETSGNPAGLFHGIVNAQDGVHARFNRAAALEARESVRVALDHHGVAGATRGLLRLETSMPHAQMSATLAALRLPPDYVQALDADAASALGGIALNQPAWFYPGGGWVHPAGLARAWLERAAAYVDVRVGTEVHALRRTAGGWCVLDAAGNPIAEAPAVVLANAGAALHLLGDPGWPIERVRGQISGLPASALSLPRVPIAGAGYLLPVVNGRAIFGATAQRGDDDPAVRDTDHAANLAQLAALTGNAVAANAADLTGRTSWRWSAADRLPVVGGVPDTAVTGLRLDQPRLVPCVSGLFVFTALGSRGITWSALGARVLAAAITGAPMPIEASLVDAIAPARFVSRAARHSARA